jgi:hypothetical protein
VIYVARQLGHGAELTLRTYGHVIEELEDSPQLSAEEAINLAGCPRTASRVRVLYVRPMFDARRSAKRSAGR